MRNKTFEIRKGQFWGAGDGRSYSAFIIGEVLKTSRDSVTIKDCLNMSESTISKDALFEGYKYVPKRGAEMVIEKYHDLIKEGVVPKDAWGNMRDRVKQLRAIDIGEVANDAKKQLDLPIPPKAQPRVPSRHRIIGRRIVTDGGVKQTTFEEAQKNLLKDLDKPLFPAVKPGAHFTENHGPGTSIMPAAARSHLLKRKFELETELEAIKIALAATWK